MLNTKFNLYKVEWLDLVFVNRNKNYGAYYLRQHYASNMVKAMVITFITVITAATFWSRVSSANNTSIPPDDTTVVNITPQIPHPPKPVKPEVVPPKSAAPAKPITTERFVTYHVTNEPVTEEAPVIAELTEQVGTVTQKGDPGAVIDIPEEVNTSGGGGISTPIEDVSVHNTGTLEIQPEPYGGMEAFAKFLSKNLHYPAIAEDKGVQGRVVLSFVIEKDGHLSNIKVDKGAGYGFDEEALRVLKMAKAWKPGIQNGRPVRVSYAIPINFQMPQ
ncbi:energy transducer TonB [Mucilaginibacter segetis]|uniref:Energy transducer TonB n=1 Tax=Mucilaginibacter segetis TaxID=2793071 RepID=A0A934PTI5_9SPHI|nr:energy transducer TonB [Mucilaginibacter segetis]MBK0378785.1 energy transducer TonB [Mucilaginibacter segetis]